MGNVGMNKLHRFPEASTGESDLKVCISYCSCALAKCVRVVFLETEGIIKGLLRLSSIC